MGEFSVWHWLIVALVLVMLFGAKRLPDTARSLGQALRLFKKETSRLGDDDAETVTGDRPSTPAPALSIEEQARQLEEQAARLRAQAGSRPDQQPG
ncbi:Sec-independent protein translocase subunit TatA [Planotetraspora sp. A-T 1434]|uniref:Sec-independent protein translocase subunit TatA n=1 Tax=Planotetraspora sp. A-T 1434 TaxID=2979219 RepID=UPI0021BF838B|nr:Sec-independent protein translocase subunit TatA [Planotetraspora sp. A-T 1434]MCT9932270.1 Sec-independent protein translocase subunit TatA [Planotetraspora sp. A-T 1434]